MTTYALVIPAFNEEAGVGKVVKEFKSLGIFDEILVVDNNSSDNTAIIASGLGARVIREKRQGYGYAIRTGIKESTSDVIVLVEADATFEPTETKILLVLLEKYDLVKSARSHRYFVNANADWGVSLKLGNYIVAKFMQLLYFGIYFYELPTLREMGGTFRAFRRTQYLAEIDPFVTENTSAYLADMTTLYLRKQLKIIEIPLSYLPRLGVSKVTGDFSKAVRLGFRMLYIVVRNRFRPLPKNR